MYGAGKMTKYLERKGRFIYKRCDADYTQDRDESRKDNVVGIPERKVIYYRVVRVVYICFPPG